METIVDYTLSFTPGGGRGHLAFRTEGRVNYDRMDDLSPADVAAVAAMFSQGPVGFVRASGRFVVSPAAVHDPALNEPVV